MKIQCSTAVVTGANRGLGAAIVTALSRAGAKKVYAAARERFEITDLHVEYVRLDVAADIAAARHCDDVDLLINNAGMSRFKSFLSVVADQRVAQLTAIARHACNGRARRLHGYGHGSRHSIRKNELR